LIGALLIGVLFPPSSASAQQRPAIADKIAKTYGIDSWDQIEAIRYTYNLEAGPVKLSRSWVWEPKADQITYEGKDKAGNPVKVTYSRSKLASQNASVKDEVDPSFFNDQYTLLFPFHVVWGYGRDGDRCRQDQTDVGERFRREGRGEVSVRRRLRPG
jgi:hypothetical protein